MQQMVDAVTLDSIQQAIRLRTRVRGIYRHNGGWRVAIEMGGDELYDAVILATPANVAGTLLESVDRESGARSAGHNLQLVGHCDPGLLHGPTDSTCLPGFGFLVPRSEGTRMLACTFVHNKFPHRAPPDKGILRCFLGGARDEAVLALTDDEMLDTVRAS